MERQSIVYFAKEWDPGHDRTSCDHVFARLAKANKVLWVNSVATRTPSLASGADVKRLAARAVSYLNGLRQVGPTSWIYQPPVLPLPYSQLAMDLNARLLGWSLRRILRRLGMLRPQVWTFLPNIGYIIGHLDESIVVYYCTDEWSAFSYVDGPKIAAMERELLERVDVCFATSHALVDAKKVHNPRTYYAGHGVDHGHFAHALDPVTNVPDDIAGLPRPIVGFFGLIHDWIDLSLLSAMATARRDWSIVLIGPSAVDLDSIRNQPNIHVLGARPYATLPAYAKAFDVGMIPFSTNKLAEHINPIKLREYLSAGLPVVSTDLPEVRREPLAQIASTPDDFIVKVGLAISDDSEERRRQRSEAMRGETWEAKVAELGNRVLEVMGKV